jgi:hypothetical protein
LSRLLDSRSVRRRMKNPAIPRPSRTPMDLATTASLGMFRPLPRNKPRMDRRSSTLGHKTDHPREKSQRRKHPKPTNLTLRLQTTLPISPPTQPLTLSPHHNSNQTHPPAKKSPTLPPNQQRKPPKDGDPSSLTSNWAHEANNNSNRRSEDQRKRKISCCSDFRPNTAGLQ